MFFEIEMSEHAETQYDNILSYLAYKIRNPQAVLSVQDDFDFTINQLEKNADAFGFCKNPKLHALGLRKLHFSKHRYFVLYRIVDTKVIIEGIYHDLQDYENAIK